MVRAVLFDLDDTLYDAASSYKAGQEALRQYVKSAYQQEVWDFNEKYERAKWLVKNRLGEVASSHNRLLYIQTYLELSGRRSASDALFLYNLYWDAVLDNMDLFEYVVPLMRELQSKDRRIGILTDLTANIQYRKLERLGIGQYVDAIVTSEEAGCEKPSHEMFDLALEKLSARPEEALMIGDSQTKDVDGAITVGMKAVLYRKGRDIITEVRNYL